MTREMLQLLSTSLPINPPFCIASGENSAVENTNGKVVSLVGLFVFWRLKERLCIETGKQKTGFSSVPNNPSTAHKLV